MGEPAGVPPKPFRDFSERFPKIAQAWELLSEAGAQGPLDGKTQRLIKLAVSIGSRTEGATHSATRKALQADASPEELFQVIALAASTVGLPNAVAAFTWVEDVLHGRGKAPRKK
jgi:alkylhydroperoxidase/carboxymuconolactone decarboxylase family protein YurZ